MPRVNLIQLRGGTAAAWTSANPVLDSREPGLETDTRKIKYGDGSTAWNSLSYSNGDQKQDALVSGTNIKTINGSSVLGSGDLVVTAAPLTVIAGTNAAVTMLVNRHYELDGSILTADRNYDLPVPSAVGDRIRVSLTNGNASWECIVRGTTGITVNGGSAGAEWSRLFIAREYAEFRATSVTNWDVWDDGRVNEYCEIFGTATTAFVTSAYTRFTMAGSDDPHGLANTNCIVPRRTGLYSVSAHSLIQPSGGQGRQFGLAFAAVGSTGNTGSFLLANIAVPVGVTMTANVGVPISSSQYAVTSIGNGFFYYYFTDGSTGTNSYFTAADLRPRLTVVRVG